MTPEQRALMPERTPARAEQDREMIQRVRTLTQSVRNERRARIEAQYPEGHAERDQHIKRIYPQPVVVG
jgi:hypothetical protein